jgi:hypothetical protein
VGEGGAEARLLLLHEPEAPRRRPPRRAARQKFRDRQRVEQPRAQPFPVDTTRRASTTMLWLWGFLSLFDVAIIERCVAP